ncbi:MAG: nucleotidyltransferase family protein [Alphaproteobacteria bacterium]
MSSEDFPAYKAFILAAGFGTRLRPVTEKIPKPIVQINGRSLLWRTLDRLRAYGTREVVVNAHYLPEHIKDHVDEYLRLYPQMCIHVSFEEAVLDTGGGVFHALHFFDRDEPFFVIAGDNLWIDRNDDTYGSGRLSALQKLACGWDDHNMDILTLMKPVLHMRLTDGVGDYHFREDGRVFRSFDKTGTHMWTNIRLNHPRVFEHIDKQAFSFLEIMDWCERQGRLWAQEYDGQWYHISTPDDLECVDRYIREAEDISGGFD